LFDFIALVYRLGHGRIVGNPDITPFSPSFRNGSHPGGTQDCASQVLDEWVGGDNPSKTE
jgi:hypothetical protein